LAGFLFEADKGLPTVAMVLAAGSLLAAIALLFLQMKTDDPQELAAAESEPEAEGMGMPATT